MRRELRIGILGMGGMGSRHGGNLLKMEDVKISGLCSIPWDDASRFNSLHGTAIPVFDDFDEMLAATEMDALYVCLPPFAHDGQIEKAASKGIAVFAEKPLALTVAKGKEIVDAVNKYNVKSQMGYHMRFGAAVERLRELMNAGETGRPTLFCANYECNSLHSHWWRDIQKCGGQIFEQVIHLYDEALYFMGNAYSVSGFQANLCHRHVDGYTVEDTSAVSICFANGALGSITGSNCAIPGVWDARWRIVFETMVASFQDMNNAQFIWTDGSGRREEIASDRDPYQMEDAYFLSVLQGEKAEFAPVREGLIGLQLVSAATQSARLGGQNIKIME